MIALVAHPGQQHLLQLLASRLEISAILNPWRTPFRAAPAPVFSQLSALLAAGAPDACCFLRPYGGLEQDISTCLERQVRVLSAGPADLPASPLWNWGGQHLHSPLFQAASGQRRSPAFGTPVYLRRLVGGGTDLLDAWWAACQLLTEARDLIGAEAVEVQLAACRAGRQHHLALTVAFANRATAHLVVAPHYFSPSTDLTLLGSGGLVFSDAPANAAHQTGSSGVRLHPPPFLHPEPGWIAEFLQRLDQPAPAAHPALELHLLAALRQALRLGQLVRVR
ncbi:MAG: hypothetical protein HYW07_14375 [Candidatus Latescibacteria bacterium]|nr:hypothetical protein [Candidatus Latescibacterota bacterium]